MKTFNEFLEEFGIPLDSPQKLLDLMMQKYKRHIKKYGDKSEFTIEQDENGLGVNIKKAKTGDYLFNAGLISKKSAKK